MLSVIIPTEGVERTAVATLAALVPGAAAGVVLGCSFLAPGLGVGASVCAIGLTVAATLTVKLIATERRQIKAG